MATDASSGSTSSPSPATRAAGAAVTLDDLDVRMEAIARRVAG